MSEKFRNLIFLLCVGSCFLMLGLNIFVGSMIEQTFTSLYNEAAKAQQIMVAQDYAMQIATLAEHEAQRAHELEQNMERLAEKYIQVVKEGNNMAFQLEMQNVSIEAQCSYIGQLTELLETNNIEVPVPDMKDRAPIRCDNNGCLIDSTPLGN